MPADYLRGVNYLMTSSACLLTRIRSRNTLKPTPAEVKDLITLRSVLWLTVLGIVPAVMLARIKILFKPFWKETLGRLKRCGLLLLCLLIFLPFVYKEYASFGRNNNQVRRLVSPLNYIYATVRYFQIEHQKKRPFTKLDEAAEHVPYPDEAKTVFILVLGETARAMNFSLNGYARETNPKLKTR
jgi:lipid A ethanolaminephosphotransferase